MQTFLAWFALLSLTLGFLFAPAMEAAAAADGASEKASPASMLSDGIVTFDTPDFTLKLVRSSQTVAALQPKGAGGFDFTPGDWLERRAANGYHHLGDLTLRLRQAGNQDWRDYDTARDRHPVTAL